MLQGFIRLATKIAAEKGFSNDTLKILASWAQIKLQNHGFNTKHINIFKGQEGFADLRRLMQNVIQID